MLYYLVMGNEKGNQMNEYWREDDDALAVSVDGVVSYYGSDVSIMDVAASAGLTKDDYEYLV